MPRLRRLPATKYGYQPSRDAEVFGWTCDDEACGAQGWGLVAKRCPECGSRVSPNLGPPCSYEADRYQARWEIDHARTEEEEQDARVALLMADFHETLHFADYLKTAEVAREVGLHWPHFRERACFALVKAGKYEQAYEEALSLLAGNAFEPQESLFGDLAIAGARSGHHREAVEFAKRAVDFLYGYGWSADVVRKDDYWREVDLIRTQEPGHPEDDPSLRCWACKTVGVPVSFEEFTYAYWCSACAQLRDELPWGNSRRDFASAALQLPARKTTESVRLDQVVDLLATQAVGRNIWRGERWLNLIRPDCANPHGDESSVRSCPVCASLSGSGAVG